MQDVPVWTVAVVAAAVDVVVADVAVADVVVADAAAGCDVTVAMKTVPNNFGHLQPAAVVNVVATAMDLLKPANPTSMRTHSLHSANAKLSLNSNRRAVSDQSVYSSVLINSNN